MHINAAGVKLTEEEEAFIPFVYDDFVEPRTATDYAREWKGAPPHGTLTIGYGTTDKKLISLGKRIDRQTAEQYLQNDLLEAEAGVDRQVKVHLNENQFSALVSFVYNAGEGTLQKSTLLRLLNQGNYDAVPRELNKFIMSKGQPMKGLVRRRAREGALWSMSVATQTVVGASTPNAVLTEIDPQTPLATVEPDAVVDRPLMATKTVTGAGMTGLGTVGGVLSDAATQVQALVDYSSYIKIVFLVLTIAGIALTIYGRLDIRNKEGV